MEIDMATVFSLDEIMAGPRPWYVPLLNFLENFYPWNIWTRIVFWGQRRTRGFDESDLWSLDRTILKFCIPRLRALAALPPAGFPGILLDELGGEIEGYDADISTFEAYDNLPPEKQKILDDRCALEWQEILRKMARAMEIYVETDGSYLVCKPDGVWEPDPGLEAEFEEGWELFKKYFFALWD
jgi:hypothetical protein